MDHARFKDICAGLQSISLAVAVLVGGLWTAWVFTAQAQVARARAELARLNRDLEGAVTVQLEMEIQRLSSSAEGGPYLGVTVVATNAGSRPTTMYFPEGSPLRVSRVSILPDGTQEFAPPLTADRYWLELDGSPTRLAGQLLFAGDKDELHFLVQLPEPGIYFASFVGHHSPHDLEDAVSAGADPNIPARWTVGQYYAVE